MKSTFLLALGFLAVAIATPRSYADQVATGWENDDLDDNSTYVVRIVTGQNEMKDQEQALSLCDAKAQGCTIKTSYSGATCLSAATGDESYDCTDSDGNDDTCSSTISYLELGGTPQDAQTNVLAACNGAGLSGCSPILTYCTDGFKTTSADQDNNQADFSVSAGP